MNSPTKFEEPGIASVASATIRNSEASTGARKAMPPMSREVLRAAGACRERGDDEEQRRRHEAVVEHLQQRALAALGLQREDPERDEPSWATLE